MKVQDKGRRRGGDSYYVPSTVRESVVDELLTSFLRERQGPRRGVGTKAQSQRRTGLASGMRKGRRTVSREFRVTFPTVETLQKGEGSRRSDRGSWGLSRPLRHNP